MPRPCASSSGGGGKASNITILTIVSTEPFSNEIYETTRKDCVNCFKRTQHTTSHCLAQTHLKIQNYMVLQGI